MSKAMIFAAGLGTRLYPLTKDVPKAMIKINNTPLIEIIIKNLISFGFNDIIINIHHFGDKVVSFLEKNNNFDTNITISDERDLLLETGGGLKKASWFFNDNKPFLVYNVDILTNLNLKDFYNYHTQKGGLATLAVKTRNTNRALLFDKNNILCGWENKSKKVYKLINENAEEVYSIGFSGIHVINPDFFNLITEQGKFSIMTSYLRLAKNYNIFGYLHDNDWWIDVGSYDKLNQAKHYIP